MAMVLKLLVRILSLFVITGLVPVLGDGVYNCPTVCRCTMIKRQADRAVTAESVPPPGRKVVCQSTSLPWITSVDQIQMTTKLPEGTQYL